MVRSRKSLWEDAIARVTHKRLRKLLELAEHLQPLLEKKAARGEPLRLTRQDVEDLQRTLGISRAALYRYRKVLEAVGWLGVPQVPGTLTDVEREALAIAIETVRPTFPQVWAFPLEQIARRWELRTPEYVGILPEPWTHWGLREHRIFEELLIGLREGRTLEVAYRPPGESLLRFRFRPLRIYRRRRAWYVQGLYWPLEGPRQEEVRILRVNRIYSLRKTETVEAPERPAYELDRHFENAWEFLGGSTTREVVFRALSERVRDLIGEVQWHPTFVEDPPGTFRVRVAQPREMIPWLLQWLPDIEVLEPKELRKAVAEIAERARGLHGEHQSIKN